ncbi:MAG TPA: hypothetical protein P5016_02620 [Verrucomicrobiales bacterium]|nr:hypothetical protein [Verrucomicrobiales bacterium]
MRFLYRLCLPGAALLGLGACATKSVGLMRAGRDAFHDALFFAESGHWEVAIRALGITSGHVKRAISDRPVVHTKQGPVLLEVTLQSWEVTAWTPLVEAASRRDLPSFELAYARAGQRCASCHESLGKKEIPVFPVGWAPPAPPVGGEITEPPEPPVPAGNLPSLPPSEPPLPGAKTVPPPGPTAPGGRYDPLLPPVVRGPISTPGPIPGVGPAAPPPSVSAKDPLPKRKNPEDTPPVAPRPAEAPPTPQSKPPVEQGPPPAVPRAEKSPPAWEGQPILGTGLTPDSSPPLRSVEPAAIVEPPEPPRKVP